MFQTIIKNYQSKTMANTWQQALKKREIAKNNYHAIGDVKKAKAFANTVIHYSPHTHFVSHGEHVIFSSEALTVPLRPAYIFIEE